MSEGLRAQEQAPAVGGSAQVIVVASQLPPRQLGPYVGSQLAPTTGRSTQVPLVASHMAYGTQDPEELAQELPSARGGVQTEVVGSHTSCGALQSCEASSGLQVPPLGTSGLHVWVVTRSQ